MAVRHAWMALLVVLCAVVLYGSWRWVSSPADAVPHPIADARRETRAAPSKTDVAGEPNQKVRFARFPTRFEENVGQFDPQVRFLARRSGMTLFLTDEGATLSLRAPREPTSRPLRAREPREAVRAPDTVLTMKVAGGRDVRPVGSDMLVTKSNYFLGDDPERWRTNVANYARVIFPGILDGIDLVFHGEEGQLEYDFVVAPGADPKAIALEVEGGSGLSLTKTGDLAVETPHGTLLQPRPRVYQRGADGTEHDIEAGYRLVGESRVGFLVASYDRARELVIDPVLSYSTYLGGGAYDSPRGIAVDGSGNAYVTGATSSANFPTKNAYQNGQQGSDAFVVKVSAGGSDLVYATYLGGTDSDAASAIAVSASGEAYVTGSTESADFPRTKAYQGTLKGTRNAFVTKLSASGSTLLYSTYLGGSNYDRGTAIAVNAAGSAFVAGETYSADFPTVKGSFQETLQGADAFVVKLASDGSGLEYATFLGGSGGEAAEGLAIDASGSAYVVGWTLSSDFPGTKGHAQDELAGSRDAFVAKLNVGGSALAYATYLGGRNFDSAAAIAVDASRRAYVVGRTESPDFPTRSPLQDYGTGGDAFVTKLNADGTAFEYSTYLGGAKAEYAWGVAVDASGSAYVTGGTYSTDFPTKAPLQAALGGGTVDAFVAKVSASGTELLYSTFFGGTGGDEGDAIAVDGSGSAYIVGSTTSTIFPLHAPLQGAHAGEYDGFVAKFDDPLTLTPSSASVAPLSSMTFVASGGGAPYELALDPNNSGGSIDATTGVYTAGPQGGVTDTVTATDALGNRATATVSVTANLTITPELATVAPLETITFVASGGSGTGFDWSLTTNASGGAIDATTGVYTAGATSGVEDTITVRDSGGTTATAKVTVYGKAANGPAPTSTPDEGADAGCGCAVVGAEGKSRAGPLGLAALALAGALARARRGRGQLR